MMSENHIDKENIEQEDNPKVVYPGDVIYEGLDAIPGNGVYRRDDKIISKVIGIVKKKGTVINVIPLNGVYMPKVGDYVIGEITDIGINFWVVDINSPYDAFLGVYDVAEFVDKEVDISQIYDVGDLIYARIQKVTKTKYINLTTKDAQAKKLHKGYVIEIPPSKVPRVIGKGGSMIKTIKSKTQTKILVGQNGRVWISGKNADIAAEAIMFIEENTLMKGLTDAVSKLIDKKLEG